LAILAGLSPSQNAVTNSNSAVNTSVPLTHCDSQPLDDNSTAANTAEDRSANTSTPCQRPLLSLPQSVARSETLESPAYIPSDFSVLPNDVTETQVLEAVSADKQQAVTSAEQTSIDVHRSPCMMASVSIETETPATASVPAYEKLMPAQQTAAGKTSKFAASVRRKFTVSKTVLPSAAAPPVVVFSKLTAEAANPCDVQNVDDVGHVHIVDKARSSSVSVLEKSTVCEDGSSPSSVEISEVQPVTDVPTASTCTLESTVISKTDEPCTDDTDGNTVTAVSLLQLETAECGPTLASCTEDESVACDENVDDQMPDDHNDESTGENIEIHSSLYVQHTTPGSCAAPEHSAAESGTLACNSWCQIIDGVGPAHKDAVDLQEMTSTGDNCGMVTASQDSCPPTADDVCFNCTANELNLLSCTTDELPSTVASDDVLIAQITDSVASCSVVQRVAADVPFEASLLSTSKHDALVCDNNSQIAESMPSTAATQCSNPVQKRIDNES